MKCKGLLDFKFMERFRNLLIYLFLTGKLNYNTSYCKQCGLAGTFYEHEFLPWNMSSDASPTEV